MRKECEVQELKDKWDIQNPYAGTGVWNPFLPYDAHQRAAMAAKQRKGSYSLLNPDAQLFRTGHEFELSDHSDVIYGKRGVIKNISYYGVLETMEISIIVESLSDGSAEHIVIPSYRKYDSKYGYPIIHTELLNNLKVGDTLEDDDVLAHGPSHVNGSVTNMKVIPVANLSLSGTLKDALFVSEEFCEQVSWVTYNTITINVNRNTVLYNIYGSENFYNPLPEVGQPIHETGFIVGYLEQDMDRKGSFNITKKALRDFNVMTDGTVYRQTSKVKDSKVKEVKVYKTGKRIKRNAYNDVLFKEAEVYNQYMERQMDTLSKTYDKLNQSGRQYRKRYHAISSSDIGYLVDEEISDFVIEIVVETIHRPNLGVKIVTQHGSKGLIVKIEKNEKMPYDSDGQRALLVYDSASIQRRHIPGNKYEGSTNASILKARKIIQSFLDKGDVVNARVTTLKLLEHFDDDVTMDLVKEASDEEFIEHINEGLRPVINMYECKSSPYSILRRLMNSEFFPNSDGIWVPMENQPDYHVDQKIHIENIGVNVHYKSLTGNHGDIVTHVNVLGSPVAPPKHIKALYQYNKACPRTVSESENRFGSTYGDKVVKSMMRQRIQTSSPVAQRRLIQTILRKDYDEFEVKPEDTAKIFKNTIDAPPAILAGLFLSMGISIDKNVIRYPHKPDNCLP